MTNLLKYSKVLLAIFLCFIISSVSGYVLAAPDKPDIGIEVAAGYGDSAKLGFDVPFTISLTNRGDEVVGEVQVYVHTNPETRVIYAQPVTLPKGTNKQIEISVPVNTANRKVEVKFVQGEKSLAGKEYEFKKLISPQTPVMAVLSDDPDGYRNLNGMKLMENPNSQRAVEIQRKYAVMAASGEKVPALADRPVELFFLDKDTVPENINSLYSFDYIVISNFDTSSFGEKKKEAIYSWVSNGKDLIIGTGPNWKKVYAGMPDKLKLFSISSSESMAFPKELETFAEKASTGMNINLVRGNTGAGKILVGSSFNPLAVCYKVGKGTVTFLCFDPALSPVSGWDGVQNMWKKLVDEINKQKDSASLMQTGASITPGKSYLNMDHLASRVPQGQTPPFQMLLVIIGVYILLVGPAVYLFLKWKDKRDLTWIVVPAAALLFMSIIYVAGFKTRYTTAVLNSVSVVNLDSTKQTGTVSSTLAIFNNKRGNMRIEYSKDLDVNNNMNRYYDDYMYSYPQAQDNSRSRVLSKLTYSDPLAYEMYDVRMWDPRYLSVNSPATIKGGITNSISISNGTISGTLKNNTEMDLKEAFISIGSNIIDIGEMPAGEEKKINAVLGANTNIKRSDFFDNRYGPPHYVNGQKLPENWPELNRKRNIIESVFNAYNWNSPGQPKIFFIAFNDDFDPAFEILVNGKNPQRYNTNAVFSSMDITLEKGKPAIFPTGIVKSSLEQSSSKVGFVDGDPVNGGIRFNSNGDVVCKFSLPDSIDVEKLKIQWSTMQPSYVKYQPKNASVQYGKNEYKFFILNVAKSRTEGNEHWEETKELYEISRNPSDYMNENREIKVKVNVVMDNTRPVEELLGLPEIEISGVVK